MRRVRRNEKLKPKEVFEMFKEKIYRYMIYFQIAGWDCHFVLEDLEDSRACVNWELPGRVASYTLSLSWIKQKDFTLIELDKVAFHEVCELLLARLRSSMEKYLSYTIIDEQIHEVIRVLENTVWKKNNPNFDEYRTTCSILTKSMKKQIMEGKL